jgi:4-hydroxy-3-polyprenylbenzoate decarboxylase
MTQVTETGAVLVPPLPAFYHRPRTLDDVINQSVNKALDQFGIDCSLFQRWTGNEEREHARARSADRA